MAGTASISGLVSGLDIDSIVTKLMDNAKAPLTKLQDQKTLDQQRLAAWQDINTRILAVKVKSEGIADAVDFRAASATSSDADIVNAIATTDATPGTYYLKVTSRAQAHQVTSQAGAFSSMNDLVGTGTVHFGLANGTTFDIKIDSSNNTLTGLRDAVNKAGKGIQATIINAGTSDSPDYRLLLASTEAGTDNQMSVIDTSGLSGGAAPTFGNVSSQAGGYTSENDVVGTGAVHFQRQDGTSFDITLDSGSNTLSGLRDAINAAGQGVQATITNAGTTGSPDYRLVLNATKAGADNRFTAIDTSGLSGGTKPTFEQDSPVQAAADAIIELGQGAGHITVTKSTNTISDMIPGVTLNLLSADLSKTVRVDVTRDTSAVDKAIQDFVTQYNDLADALREQSTYDTETGDTPPLFGDYLLQTVQSDLVSTLTNPVSGLPNGFNALASLGVTQDTTGHLQVNDSQLSAALTNHMDDVAKIFGSGIESGSAYISYLASTAETKASAGAGWDVTVTQPATRAWVTAGTEMSSPLSADESLVINGESVTLTSGMNIDDVVARINSYSGQTNVVAMKTGQHGTGTGNYLTLRSALYGGNGTVTAVSGLSRSSGNTSGIGNKSVTSSEPHGEGGLGDGMAGLNVAGTINGEAATGYGQVLALNAKTNNAAKGLSLLITATEPLSSVMVRYTKGIGASFRDLLADMTSTTGTVTQAENSLTAAMSQLDTDMTDMQTRLSDQEQRLRDQFNAMEAQLSELQSQGNYLTAQFDAMNKST